MNNDDFVTYETAIKLRTHGFNLECDHYYTDSMRFTYAKQYYDWNKDNGYISAPTLAQAAKWLRNVKGLFIEVWLCAAGYSWTTEKCGNFCKGTFVTKHDEVSGDDENSGLYTTYEKSLSAGVDAALGLIKEKL